MPKMLLTRLPETLLMPQLQLRQLEKPPLPVQLRQSLTPPLQRNSKMPPLLLLLKLPMMLNLLLMLKLKE